MNPPIICINKETIINGSLSAKALAGKTLIVKNTDLQLNPDQDATDQPLHLFIDQGNLFLPSSIATGDLQSFDAFGYLKTPAPSEEKSLAKAQFLKGNIIINGLLLGGDEDTPQSISNKLYIHGKFSSFNTLKQATLERIAMLRNLFPGPNSREQYISFDTLFDWKCLSGKGSDGTRCKGVSKKEAQQLGKKSELLVDKAFGLIDMDFSNPLFR